MVKVISLVPNPTGRQLYEDFLVYVTVYLFYYNHYSPLVKRYQKLYLITESFFVWLYVQRYVQKRLKRRFLHLIWCF